ncbi:IclR family transcriptional regulator [Amycolatopsis rubida]|uniref:IclR family transcriptional regulator n=1 Tax=Amycolatopsis rubida TaxID=112413 RepID=A0ABX0C8A0_9PSEU|nr:MULTISPECIES: IclR family transcriptional regulator [Amycolatopsis]MYW96147.1 helix-turn-helix domain-containing protein [Amycolatopsis rubida]NEC61138.1 IclR family transcriptional regulator [Amycolatopsis rubida]
MAAESAEHVVLRGPEHRTVGRVMTILEAVIASEPAGLRLADLPSLLDAPKSSIHGLTKGLVAAGYLRENQGRYFQGPAVYVLALNTSPIPAAYHHALEVLSKTWNETALMATLAGDAVINVDIAEANQVIRASPPTHERRPMWPGSSGKVFLAFMDPRSRDSYLSRKHTEPGERERILAELETIRETGVAFNRGESVPDLYGVASPITTDGLDVTLAVGLAGPATRMAASLDEIAVSVRETAQRLSDLAAAP